MSVAGSLERAEKIQLKIGGMACSFCVASITKALGRMDGVHNVNVNLAHEETLIEFNPQVVTAGALKETLRELGYTIRDTNKVKAYEEQEAELLQQRRVSRRKRNLERALITHWNSKGVQLTHV